MQGVRVKAKEEHQREINVGSKTETKRERPETDKCRELDRKV